MTQHMPSKILTYTERNKSKWEMCRSCWSWLEETSFTPWSADSIEKMAIDCFQDKETWIFVCSLDLLHAWMFLKIPCLPCVWIRPSLVFWCSILPVCYSPGICSPSCQSLMSTISCCWEKWTWDSHHENSPITIRRCLSITILYPLLSCLKFRCSTCLGGSVLGCLSNVTKKKIQDFYKNTLNKHIYMKDFSFLLIWTVGV